MAVITRLPRLQVLDVRNIPRSWPIKNIAGHPLLALWHDLGWRVPLTTDLQELCNILPRGPRITRAKRVHFLESGYVSDGVLPHLDDSFALTDYMFTGEPVLDVSLDQAHSVPSSGSPSASWKSSIHLSAAEHVRVATGRRTALRVSHSSSSFWQVRCAI